MEIYLGFEERARGLKMEIWVLGDSLGGSANVGIFLISSAD